MSFVVWASIGGTAAVAWGQNPTEPDHEHMRHDVADVGWQARTAQLRAVRKSVGRIAGSRSVSREATPGLGHPRGALNSV